MCIFLSVVSSNCCHTNIRKDKRKAADMGCVNSKAKEDPTNAGVKYDPATTPAPTTSVPGGGGGVPGSTHQPLIQQSSQQRQSVISGDIGSRNGSLGYNPPQPVVPPPLQEDDGSLFIARYAYQARTSEDLSFEKGEKLKVRRRRGKGGLWQRIRREWQKGLYFQAEGNSNFRSEN